MIVHQDAGAVSLHSGAELSLDLGERERERDRDRDRAAVCCCGLQVLILGDIWEANLRNPESKNPTNRVGSRAAVVCHRPVEKGASSLENGTWGGYAIVGLSEVLNPVPIVMTTAPGLLGLRTSDTFRGLGVRPSRALGSCTAHRRRREREREQKKGSDYHKSSEKRGTHGD